MDQKEKTGQEKINPGEKKNPAEGMDVCLL
jgi:hypothetical protein